MQQRHANWSRFTAALAVSLTLLVLTGLRAGATSSDDLDIGSPGPAGGTSFSSGVYTISGSGTDISGANDHFHFNKGALTGDGAVTAYVQSVGTASRSAKAGVMLRGSIASNSAMAAVLVTPGYGVAFQYRTAAGGLRRPLSGPKASKRRSG